MDPDYVLPFLPVSLPSAVIPAVDDPAKLKSQWQDALSALSPDHFVADAVWRDMFALTGTTRTFYGPNSITAAWKETSAVIQCHDFKIIGEPQPHGPGRNLWLDIAFSFQARGPPSITGSATMSLVPNDQGEWRIWMLKTVLEQLQNQPNVDLPPKVPSPSANGTNGSAHPAHFDCVVMGGGQSGLAMGGRLQSMGISYVVLDKWPRVGDSWRRRYDSAKLHTIRELSHLPYDRTYSKEYYAHEWLTKDELGEGHERWVGKFGINVWQSTNLISGRWDESTQQWTLSVERNNESSKITCSYFVYAAGFNCDIPKRPNIPDEERFQGTVLHSKDYKNAKQWHGRDGIIIGSANTAHDVAENMVDAGMASVTMVQRSPTFIISAEHNANLQRGIHNEKLPTEVSDRIVMGGPLAIGRLMHKGGMAMQDKATPGWLDGMERAGFKLKQQEDLFYSLFVRLGGHYVDIGSVARISAGEIKVKSDSPIERFTPDGLRFANGDSLKADVVILATGFESDMRAQCARLFGPEVADHLEDVWGMDAEGELKGCYKPCGHPAFWFMLGAFAMSRFMSRFVALQMKAKMMGTPLKLYTKTPFPIEYRKVAA